METFLVGGAVRDSLLGLPVMENDWVVVGANPATMIAAGYQQVGRDFPVFLHPETKEEYALARTERKTGSGHTGFECHADETVTLEEDLARRDLTINAIARDARGKLIDPFHGCADIESRVLRHISCAFEEDPLRILRVARFLARLAPLGFTVAPETMTLCQKMVARGDLTELPAERIFAELDKALLAPCTRSFFHFLADVGAGEYLWPELSPDVPVWLQAADPQLSAARKFALIFSGTDPEKIRHRCGVLKVPRRYRDLALLCGRYLNTWSRVDRLPAEDIVALLYDTDALRRKERFVEFCETCTEILKARGSPGRQQERWLEYLDGVSRVTSGSIDGALQGREVGAAIRDLQTRWVETRHAG